MPHDLASDPSKTVFDYAAIVSPPRDWDRWHALIRDLVQHLADRYGLDELVEHWSFEVWNEANLEVFWSGTPEDYLHLYDVTADAVRSVDDRLRVGGPSSAASGWVEELLAHAERSGSPVDFVTTHTYGSPPLDFRPMLERYGREGTPIWWTEWGVTPTHFNEVSDAVFAGTFLLRGMASSMDRIESLSYWVVSDHFEELGRPPALLHGGFGTRTVGELRKPRWWALALLERLGRTRIGVELDGDGAGSLVEALADTFRRRHHRRPDLEPHARPDEGLGLARPRQAGGPVGDRPRAGGVVRRPPRPRRRRPLRHRSGVGPDQRPGPGLADRRPVGHPARGRPPRSARPRRDARRRRRGSGRGEVRPPDALDVEPDICPRLRPAT